MKKAAATKQQIIETAKHYILANHFHALTLEAVAKEAGISKGGLLYHFPSKEQLIISVAQHVFEQFDQRLNELALADSNEYGKWARAYIQTAKEDLLTNRELYLGIFAVSLLHKEAADHLSELYTNSLALLKNDSLNELTLDFIRLTIDGLYYSKVLNAAPLSKQRTENILNQLIQLTWEVRT
ncbi:MAG: TetR/AcrR family transcriptional regulator [Solibacillus sp.]